MRNHHPFFVCLLIICLAPTTWAQDTRDVNGVTVDRFGVPVIVQTPAEETAQTRATAAVQTNDDPFRRSLLKAAREARRNGTITRRDQIRLRVAMMSPAFRQHAEDMVVTQMAFSGDTVPTLEDGEKIDRAGINWDGLLKFLEAFIPLLLQLIDALGMALVAMIGWLRWFAIAVICLA